jgi:hypothetical protein
LLEQQERYGAQILTTTDSRSIYYAYERMRRKAEFGTVVYLHDDVQLYDQDTTERVLAIMRESGAGLLGVVGSKAGHRRIPWWETEQVGFWMHTKKPFDGIKYFDPARRRIRQQWTGKERAVERFVRAELLDGIFLADRLNLPWPRRLGWHGYDAERCEQTREAGHSVFVGDVLVCHHNQAHGQQWQQAIEPRYDELRQDWGLA